MYSINDVAEMTGLSTRTLRSYLKNGVLDGEKQEGVWRFTEDQISRFMENPAVRSCMQAKRNALVYDFMGNRYKKENEMCVILDLPCDQEESQEVMEFFCDAVNCCEACANLKLGYSKSGGQTRVILTGLEECVVQVMREYYK